MTGKCRFRAIQCDREGNAALTRRVRVPPGMQPAQKAQSESRMRQIRMSGSRHRSSCSGFLRRADNPIPNRQFADGDDSYPAAPNPPVPTVSGSVSGSERRGVPGFFGAHGKNTGQGDSLAGAGGFEPPFGGNKILLPRAPYLAGNTPSTLHLANPPGLSTPGLKVNAIKAPPNR